MPTTVHVLNPMTDLKSHVEEGRGADPVACRQRVYLEERHIQIRPVDFV